MIRCLRRSAAFASALAITSAVCLGATTASSAPARLFAGGDDTGRQGDLVNRPGCSTSGGFVLSACEIAGGR